MYEENPNKGENPMYEGRAPGGDTGPVRWMAPESMSDRSVSGPETGRHEAADVMQQRSSGIEETDIRRGADSPSRAQDYNSSRSNAEYNYDRKSSTTDDAGLSKADSKRALDDSGDGDGTGGT